MSFKTNSGDTLTERMVISSEGALRFNAYGAGTLITDASGNITVSSGGGTGGPYLPLAGGTLTGNLTGTTIGLTGGITADHFRTNAGNTGYNLLTRNNTGSTLYVQAAQSNTNQQIAKFSYGSATAGAGNTVLQVAKDESYFVNCNVGIGTTSPDDILEIKKANSQLRLTDSDDSKFVQFSYSGGKLITRNNSTNTSVNQTTLTEDGKFGIGTTNPSTKLHVVGSAGEFALTLQNTSNGDGLKILTANQTVNNGFLWNQGSSNLVNMYSSSTTNASKMIMLAGGVDKIFFNTEGNSYLNGGNVGIGTTSPDANLDVEDITPRIRLSSTSTTTSDEATVGAIDFYTADTSSEGESVNAKIEGFSDDIYGRMGLRFFTGGEGAVTEKMRISNNGALKFNTYGAGTLVSDASGNITVSSGGGAGGPYLPLTGGTLSGNLTISGATKNLFIFNTSETQAGIVFGDTQGGTSQRAAIKFDSSTETLDFFVNDETSERMSISTVGVLTINGGNITLLGTGRITGIDTVTALKDATSKAYVDSNFTAKRDLENASVWFNVPGIATTLSPRNDGYWSSSSRKIRYTTFQANFDNLTLESGYTYYLVISRYKKGGPDNSRSSDRTSNYKIPFQGGANGPYAVRPTKLQITSLVQNFDFRPDLYYTGTSSYPFPRPSGYKANAAFTAKTSRQNFAFRIQRVTNVGGAVELSKVVGRLGLLGDRSGGVSPAHVQWKTYQ